jgi:circadian clock protein KaiC
VADGIILLDHESRGMEIYHYLEVLKMRGDDYFSGRHPFTISAERVTVYPRLKAPASPAPYPVVDTRVSLGVPGLDGMVQGGLLSATSTLVAESAGTGKTLLCLHLLLQGIRKGEPGLLITFQETSSIRITSYVATFSGGSREMPTSLPPSAPTSENGSPWCPCPS